MREYIPELKLAKEFDIDDYPNEDWFRNGAAKRVVLSTIIGEFDTHDKNWGVDEVGQRVIAIDKALAFKASQLINYYQLKNVVNTNREVIPEIISALAKVGDFVLRDNLQKVSVGGVTLLDEEIDAVIRRKNDVLNFFMGIVHESVGKK